MRLVAAIGWARKRTAHLFRHFAFDSVCSPVDLKSPQVPSRWLHTGHSSLLGWLFHCLRFFSVRPDQLARQQADVAKDQCALNAHLGLLVFSLKLPAQGFELGFYRVGFGEL